MSDPIDFQGLHDRVSAALAYDEEASCITAVAHATKEAVLKTYGVAPGLQPRPYLELVELGAPYVAVFEMDGGVVAVEDNGYHGIQGPFLSRLASRTRAAAVYWNAHFVTEIALASNGSLVLSRSPDGLNLTETPLDPEVERYFWNLDFDEYWLESSFAILERFTGVHIAGEAPAEKDYLVYPFATQFR